ncbi:hypothetical protein NPIL_581731 [Nephila pilipes]|uniref:Regulatory factor X-associated protein RFXANK-binding domain-containing protein n=1 Tax=Nephila pilipes TaxID=299642 RepID=A0A8X6QQY7_NEPPI|nr:hypothetical protein NPIL_581731 [Nephila pilipes]
MSKSKTSKKKCVTPLLDPNSEIKTEITTQNLIASDKSLPSTAGKACVAKVCIKSEGTSNDSSHSSAAFSFGWDISSDIGSDYMKNSILEEVLNKKKAALLHSPEVVKLLREEQLKIQNRK